jgi:hypothetical protein
MLAIDELEAAVGGLSRLEEQRIAAGAHRRIEAQHRAKLEGCLRQRPRRRRHEHAVAEAHVVAATPALVIVDGVHEAVHADSPRIE